MGIQVERLDATFGATVRGVDLRRLDDAAWSRIHGLWLEQALLIFPGQFLGKTDQIEFARRFGELEFDCAPITNLDRDGEVHSDPDDPIVLSLRGNEGWHHDSTYMPVQAKGAVFTAEIVPTSGAATGWADMRAAYDALDAETRRRVEGMRAYHSLFYSQGRQGAVPAPRDDGSYAQYGYHDGEPSLRPLVKVHPETGRRNLVIGRHAYGIVGLDPDESERFLDELNAWACEPPRVAYHTWAPGDAVVWDNRCLMHRATPFDMTEPRRMWHSRIAGDASERALNDTDVVPA